MCKLSASNNEKKDKKSNCDPFFQARLHTFEQLTDSDGTPWMASCRHAGNRSSCARHAKMLIFLNSIEFYGVGCYRDKYLKVRHHAFVVHMKRKEEVQNRKMNPCATMQYCTLKVEVVAHL